MVAVLRRRIAGTISQFFILLMIFVPALTAQTISTYKALREGFAHPPQSAKLRCYWWWLNGNTNEETITSDLEEMARMGFGGAILVDANGAQQNGNNDVPAGPLFGSSAWIRLYVHALREADRLGLEISLNITSGWNLGGPNVKPEEASKLLIWSRTTIQGGTHARIQLPDPPKKNDFYRQIAVLAYPLHHGTNLATQADDGQGSHHTGDAHHDPLRVRIAASESGSSMPDSSALLNAGPDATDRRLADTALDEVRDITAAWDGRTLDWDAPPGEWEILRIGYTDSDARVSTASGAWQGLAIDYLDHTAFDSYWRKNVTPLLDGAKPYIGRSLKYLVTDSWELGGTNWTADFRKQFTRLRGYDPLLYLPIVTGRIVEDRDISTRFLTDLRRTVADLIVTEHYDVFAAYARKNGLGIHPESGGPHGAPIDALETFRNSAMAQTEYWAPSPHRATDEDRFFCKEGASATNIYGLAYNAQEGMTSVGPQWSESPATDLKPAFDRALTEGMTRLIWHEFTSSPRETGVPGQEYFAGTHMNPKVTWWHAAGDFFLYLNRAQFLLQQGTPVDDVLYYYGDHVPNFVRLKQSDPAKVLPGYDYDVTNEDALLHTIRMDEGQLNGPRGMQWRMLMLPSTRRLSLPMLHRVEEYLHSGGTVAGFAPLSSTGQTPPAKEAEFTSLVKNIWQDCLEGQTRNYGRGTIFCTDKSRDVLRAMHVPPDFSSEEPQLDYIHRRDGDLEIYFLRNGSPKPIASTAQFRSGRKVPELWDPVSGHIAEVEHFTQQDDGTVNVPIELPAYGSTFVLFRSVNRESPNRTMHKVVREQIALAPGWQIRFQANRGAPAEAVSITDLKSWSDSPDPRIRYFSGTATYLTSFTLSREQANHPLLLSLTNVHEIAQVRINGHPVGTIWAKPFQLSMETAFKPGRNRLEIEVTNTWANRLIGDLQDGAKEHYTKTNIRKYTAASPLLPSGLIGPVSLTSLLVAPK